MKLHATMNRLYQAAKDLIGLSGQSAVASRLSQSPQTLNNWEARGMSKGGMLIAQRVIGCSAVWLETGRGDMVALAMSEPDEYRDLIAAWESLLPRERMQILDEINTKAEHNREVAESLKPNHVVRPPARRDDFGACTKKKSGARIRTKRIELKMTLKDVHELIPEISISRLSNWEQGINMVSVDAAKELATVLKVSAAYLLTLEDTPMDETER